MFSAEKLATQEREERARLNATLKEEKERVQKLEEELSQQAALQESLRKEQTKKLQELSLNHQVSILL